MREHPESNTVRGISIAVIVLSAIGLICALVLLSSMGAASAYLRANSGEIMGAAMEGMNNAGDSMTITINNRNVDLSDLSAALKKQGDDDIAVIADFLGYVSKGQIVNAINVLSTTDADSLIAAKNKFAAMTDDDMRKLAVSVSGATSTDMIALRDSIAEVEDADIRDMCAYLKTTTPEEVVSESVDLMMVILWSIVVFLLASELITLIAGILALVNAAKQEKLTAAFVLCVIGAVLSLFTCSLIRLILLIIDAVYIQKIRRASTTPPSVPPTMPSTGGPAGWQPAQPISYTTTTPSQGIDYPDVFRK